jgi:hypothetical protein
MINEFNKYVLCGTILLSINAKTINTSISFIDRKIAICGICDQIRESQDQAINRKNIVNIALCRLKKFHVEQFFSLINIY